MVETLNQQIGKRLQQVRVDRGYTQKQLAKLLGDTSDVSVSRWEKGSRSLSIDQLLKLCTVLQVNPLVLLRNAELPVNSGVVEELLQQAYERACEENIALVVLVDSTYPAKLHSDRLTKFVTVSPNNVPSILLTMNDIQSALIEYSSGQTVQPVREVKTDEES